MIFLNKVRKVVFEDVQQQVQQQQLQEPTPQPSGGGDLLGAATAVLQSAKDREQSIMRNRQQAMILMNDADKKQSTIKKTEERNQKLAGEVQDLQNRAQQFNQAADQEEAKAQKESMVANTVVQQLQSQQPQG